MGRGRGYASRDDFALVFPNRLSVGISNLGVQTIYGLITESDASCELFFSDGPLNKNVTPPSSFGTIAFSLSFEGDYPGVVAFLLNNGLEPIAENRDEVHPLVVAGGMAITINPEPLSAFIDVFYLGEAEGTFPSLIDFLIENRGAGRGELLKLLKKQNIPGIYIPEKTAPTPVAVQKAPPGWEPAHTRIISEEDAFSGAYLLEVSRGCPHGCRFCATGYINRPTRFIPVSDLEPWIIEGAKITGRLGFVGAAVSDHPRFKEIAEFALTHAGSFTLSSFRAENINDEYLSLLKQGGQRTLTVALEAGCEDLRLKVGKKMKDEVLLKAAALARSHDIRTLKIYAMVGLPGETDGDIDSLIDLVTKARREMGRGVVNLGVSPFVPKPNTPFQWEAMASRDTLTRRIRAIKSGAGKVKGLNVSAESPKWAQVQGLLSRAGREAGRWLAENPGSGDWNRILKSPEAEAILGAKPLGSRLPWDFITNVPSPRSLLGEAERAKALNPPQACPSKGCEPCGLCSDKSN
ncbi:MAG: hypothetical protein C0608_11685 [Deltaproteobacteria bacterium]|nr:MAG: hypothetical protein C0608_11685 [Deltaproteobacteria bacterium]